MNSKKPSVASIVVLLIATILYVPNVLPFLTNSGSIQIFIAAFLLPLALAAFAAAHFAGLYLAKKYQPAAAYAVVAAMHIVCISGSLLLEMILTGNPIKLCSAGCREIDLTTALACYALAVTVIFVPAYCSIIRYNNKNLQQ